VQPEFDDEETIQRKLNEDIEKKLKKMTLEKAKFNYLTELRKSKIVNREAENWDLIKKKKQLKVDEKFDNLRAEVSKIDLQISEYENLKRNGGEQPINSKSWLNPAKKDIENFYVDSIKAKLAIIQSTN
jgi:hypothetical protein